VDHLRQDVGLLPGSRVFAFELDVEQIAVGKEFADALSHLLGLELGNGGKLAKVDGMELARIVRHGRIGGSNVKFAFEAQFGATSRQTGPAGRRKELRLALRVGRIRAVHHLHNGLEVAPTGGLDGFSQEHGALSVALFFSGLAVQSAGVQGGGFAAALVAGKAADAGLGTGPGEAAIAALPLEGHKGSSGWLVGPVDLLAGLELGGVLVDVVKLDKDGVSGRAATARQHVGFLFDNHDALVAFGFKDIVDIRLFPASLRNGFDQTDTLLDEERIHASEDLERLVV